MAQIKQSKMNVADRGGFDKKHAHGSRCRYQAVALVACRRPVRTSSLIQRPVHICRLLRQMLDKISRSDTCSFLDTHTHTPSHTHTHRHTDTHTHTLTHALTQFFLPLVSNLCIIFRQAKTFHTISNAIPSCFRQALSV